MNAMKIRAGIQAAGACLALALATPAAAQWSATGIGVAEYDTDQALLLLAGLSASPGGTGIAPLIGVQGYYLTYDAGTTRANVTAIRPYAGLRSGFTGGSLNATVGYAFTNKDTGTPIGSFGADRGDGVVLSSGLDYWGTGGPLGYQALASYNFGSESFWGRGRVTRRLGEAAPAHTRIGAEVAFMSGQGYSAWQPGALVEFHRDGGSIFGLGAGGKFSEGGNSAFYVKAETVLPLFGR